MPGLPSRTAGPVAPRWLFGTLSVALALLLPRPSGACDPPPRFESMKIKGTSKDTYNAGEQVEYECRPGYSRLGPGNIMLTCNADNTWVPQQEACKKKQCSHPGEPINGRITTQVSGPLLFGSSLEYACNEGFYLLGAKTIYCELSGSGNKVDWDNDPPHCEKVRCQPPPKIPNGKYTNDAKDVFDYNEVVTYSCNPSNGPDEYSLVGEKRLFCSSGSKWSSAPPECKVVKCAYPVLQNGSLKSGMAKKFYYNAQVVLQCNAGFYLSGPSDIVCGSNSTWEPALPSCIPVPTTLSTKPPISTVSGDINPDDVPPTSQDLGPGTICIIVFSCIGGAVLVGMGLYKFKQRQKSRKADVSAEYNTYHDKSTTPTEDTH